MLKRIVALGTISAMAAVITDAGQASEQGVRYLTVAPQVGHATSTVYVSGFGLIPGQQTTLFWWCGENIPVAFRTGNQQILSGPTTNRQGNFLAFPVGIHLKVLVNAPCHIYAGYRDPNLAGANFQAVDIPALFTVLPHDAALPPCDRHICARVSPHPLRVRAGLVERIDIKSNWYGALAKLRITYPHLKRATFARRQLDWNGLAHLTVTVPHAASGEAGRAVIRASLALGRMSGTSSATFTVVRP